MGAAQRLSLLCVCLSLPLIRCLSLLQSSPQNRPLIIVWCVSGSAVRSYKQRLDVFIADREREAAWSSTGRLMEADYRGEGPGSRPFQPAVKATGAFPPSFFSTTHGSSVWSGSELMGWAGRCSSDMTLTCPTMKCAHAYMKRRQKRTMTVSMESRYLMSP